MRAEFAVFNGSKIVSRHLTKREAFLACGFGEHVRQWIYGYFGNGRWESV
jgi:hypothetical protein